MKKEKWVSRPEYKEKFKQTMMKEDPEYYEFIKKKYSDAEVFKCPKCGNLVCYTPGANYCDQCGYKIYIERRNDKMKEWKIDNGFMKFCFTIAVISGIISTIWMISIFIAILTLQ